MTASAYSHIAIQHVSDFSQSAALIRRALPEGAFRRIVLKPNWVRHAEHPEFPIEALVTSTALIEQCLDACLEKYVGLEKITVGDVPLQTCDWEQLVEQTGLSRLIEKYRGRTSPIIQFLDLRRERWSPRAGFLELDSDTAGDPSGYSEIVIDQTSLLEEVSHNAGAFRVSDYDPTETVSVHQPGRHRYLVARTVLEADLVINLPKMKTHQKSGLTGALKNLVGINGSKAYLVHHQLGKPSQGGDEFAENVPWVIQLQAVWRERLQKKSRWLFRSLKAGWEVIKRVRGIKTLGTRENLTHDSGGKFYVGSGSWHGNDSIWRMVYDLNAILVLGPTGGGPLCDTPQRRVLSILDGLVAGEGNGPLQPLPVPSGLVMASENPFLVDFCMAAAMGFDWRKIRLLHGYRRFAWRPMVAFAPDAFEVCLDGVLSASGVAAVPLVKHFLPAPGWKGHIELAPAPV